MWSLLLKKELNTFISITFLIVGEKGPEHHVPGLFSYFWLLVNNGW